MDKKMKRAIHFSVVTLCLPLMMAAQAYVPTLNENATWQVQCGPLGMSCGNYIGTGIHYFASDTIIQNLDYKVVAGEWSGGQYHEFYLREDTVSQQVYYYNTELTPATDLLYDYSLEVGDTLLSDYFNTWGNPGDNVISAIDTITLLNNQKRRRFHLMPPMYYIEGIGGSTGIGNTFLPGLGVGLDLTCYKEFGIPLINPADLQYNDCSIVLGQQNISEPTPVSIIPNPTTGPITITTEQAAGQTFQLLDLTGKQVFSTSLSSSVETLDLQHLEQGAYLYGLNGHVYGKLIVQH